MKDIYWMHIFEKWKLLKSDCFNMPCESFDSNWPQITTGQHSDKWKIAIYGQNSESEKRAKQISHNKVVGYKG